MDIQIIDPTQYPNWDKLLLSAPGTTFFHTSVWAKVLRDSYGYVPLYFAILSSGGIRALIPVMEVNSVLTGRRGISLPFTDYCDPIINGTIQLQDVLGHVVKYGKEKRWRCLEYRWGKGFLSDVVPSSHYFGHTLDLARKKDGVFSSFRKGTKSAIKKAVAEGVEVKICNSLESIKEFYRLNSMTRKRHGLPPQPYHFFKKVYDHIISKNLGFVVLGSIQNNAIAGGVYFHFGEKAVFKYGASDMSYQNLRANNLVIWEAIKWYCEKGYKSFCFGRTEPENEGLRLFKTGWGTKERVIDYYKYDLIKGDFTIDYPRITKFYHKVFTRMPIPLLNIIGSFVYKHVG